MPGIQAQVTDMFLAHARDAPMSKALSLAVVGGAMFCVGRAIKL